MAVTGATKVATPPETSTMAVTPPRTYTMAVTSPTGTTRISTVAVTSFTGAAKAKAKVMISSSALPRLLPLLQELLRTRPLLAVLLLL